MTKSMTLKVVTSCSLIIAIFLLPWTSAYGEPLNLTGDLNVSGDMAVVGSINATTGSFDRVNVTGESSFNGNVDVTGALSVNGVDVAAQLESLQNIQPQGNLSMGEFTSPNQ